MRQLALLVYAVIVLCNSVCIGQQMWPPNLFGSDKNGVAMLEGADLLQVPSAVRRVVNSASDAQLAVAKIPPKVEFV